MKLIVGLGNPGEKYIHNRHNVGFMVLDSLINTLKLEPWKFDKKFDAEIIRTKDVLYAKPQTFMNESGHAVSAISRFYKIQLRDIYVIHDDLDIALGKHKIQFGKGPQVHNGLLSIEKELGSDQFWNIRIGVENREVRGNKGIPGVEYSLQNFRPDEKLQIDTVISAVVQQMIDIG